MKRWGWWVLWWMLGLGAVVWALLCVAAGDPRSSAAVLVGALLGGLGLAAVYTFIAWIHWLVTRPR